MRDIQGIYDSVKVTSLLSNSHLNYFQVHADFEVYGGALGLVSCCLYGGAPYQSQEIRLKRGVDIVVGTPGRVKVPLLSFSFRKGFDNKHEGMVC